MDNEPTATLWMIANDLELTAEELAAASRQLVREHGVAATQEAFRLTLLATERLTSPEAGPAQFDASFSPTEEVLAPIGGPSATLPTVGAALKLIEGWNHQTALGVEDPFLQGSLLAIHNGPLGVGVYIYTLMGASALTELDDDGWQAVRIAFTETDPPATSTR